MFFSNSLQQQLARTIIGKANNGPGAFSVGAVLMPLTTNFEAEEVESQLQKWIDEGLLERSARDPKGRMILTRKGFAKLS